MLSDILQCFSDAENNNSKTTSTEVKSNGSDVSSQSSEGKNETNNKKSSYTTEGPKQLASHDTAGKIFYYERSKHKIYDL